MNGYLTRAEITKLDAILRTVPWLARQLRITTLRQDRITGAPIPTIVTGAPGVQPLPYNAHARAVADHLHATLVLWCRHTLEQRGMHYEGDPSTTGTARWLRTHIDALALTEDSARALTDIHGATASAWEAIDRPDEKIRRVDPDSVDEARHNLLHARGIAALARELGPSFSRLTQDRVESLHRNNHITPVAAPVSLGCLYLVGDVLDAHERVKTRQRGRNREKVSA